MALNPTHFYFLVSQNPKPEPTYPNVKRVFIRRNVWDNYGLFVGSKKVLDGADKSDLIDRAAELYPNAEIIDKTII